MQNEKEKFKEDFVKRLIRFSIKILKFCEKMRVKRILWSIIDQLIRSAASIGANVVEAKSSSSRKDYLRFFEIALKSANETKYWLILIRETMPEFKVETELILKEADEISKVIGASVLTLKGKKWFFLHFNLSF
ncbi:four helix bundle protein [bacterium]|nr:four helix bundle protein [bacterium]